MTRAEIIELAGLLKKLGEEIEPEEETRAHRTDANGEDNIRDFYLPRVPENFYYDPKVFRRLLGIR
jgi:hypothetical protein